MAKRPTDDGDDEDDLPKVRKRRYKPKKQADDEEDAPSPPDKKGKSQEDDEDEDLEEDNSTGYVILDIALDFLDDCIDWSKAHFFAAVIIGILSFLIVSSLAFYTVYSFVRYLHRPSLETVVQAYDLGLFPETKRFADEALRYISRSRPAARSPFIFFQGAALCAIAERVVPADRLDYYLIAANYLKESARYNFLPSRAAEGWFLLGKSLFYCGELEQCRPPLLLALDEKYPITKELHWYLAQAYFLGASPDLQLARKHLQLFQNEPTALEEEIAESRLLETLIVLHIKDIESAEAIFAAVPRFRQFDILRNFVDGQIEFFKARRIRQQAIDFETDPNPSLLQRPSVPPASASPTVPALTPPVEVPSAPAPVSPMDDAAIRNFMVPDNPPAPVLGVFDSTSDIQQRFAEMRSQYADDTAANNTDDDDIIVLPREEAPRAPVPPPWVPPLEDTVDPFDGDPILRLARELRDTAAEHYRRAIDCFFEVTRLGEHHDKRARTARLLIGICYMEMGDVARADDYFHRLIETFPDSHEAAAAGFFVAEQQRIKGNPDTALRFFAQAFHSLRRATNYASLWLPKEVIVERCIEMIRSDVEKQCYADAVGLLSTLAGVLPTEDIARLSGETYESWGTLLQSQADVTFGEQGEKLAREAMSKWRYAGAAFAALAQLCSDKQEFTDLLWRAAESYRIGKDFRQAAIEYRKFTRANLIARRPEVHLRLGEMYLHLDLLDEGASLLEEALRDYPTHFSVPQIRLVLSHVYSEQQEWDKAKALLRLNLIGDAAPTSGSYRDSMYALGQISYTQGDWDSAIPYLEDAIKVHPEAIQAADANYLLARAYLEQVGKKLSELAENPPESVRRTIETIVQTNRDRALSHLDQTAAILSDRQRALGLTEAEKLMYRNVQFMFCAVLMDMERYDLAVPRLNTISTMFQDRSEVMEALSKLAVSLQMLGRETEAQTTLRRAEVILSQLEKSGTIAEAEAAQWRDVFQSRRRP